MYDLHTAACNGLTRRIETLLSRGAIDVDEPGPNGFTPLMLAATAGHLGIVKMLINKGANPRFVGDIGRTSLHGSAQGGHLAVAKLLVKAGANLEVAMPSGGSKPLHMAAENGHPSVVSLLIEAGANINSRDFQGSSPLHKAAFFGHAEVVKVLIRAEANALLTFSSPSGNSQVPLDFAAQRGHLEVVRELIQEYGIGRCGGASGGLEALQGAAEKQHVGIMAELRYAGVFDTGQVLLSATEHGREASVKFLLQQKDMPGGGGVAYLSCVESLMSRTPLLCAIDGTSPRIVRMLIDAGADTATPVGITNPEGRLAFRATPLTYVSAMLRDKTVGANVATEAQLESLQAIRRLLMRVEAVRAESWMWARDAPSTSHATAEGAGDIAMTTSTSLTSVLPILRRRAQRHTLLSALLFRTSKKP